MLQTCAYGTILPLRRRLLADMRAGVAICTASGRCHSQIFSQAFYGAINVPVGVYGRLAAAKGVQT